MNSAAIPAELLAARFWGRSDVYLAETSVAAEWVRAPVTAGLLARHIRGELRLGVAPNGSTAYGVLDFDGKNGAESEAWARAQRLAEILDADAGLRPLVEISRSTRGWHIWVLTSRADAPTVAEMREMLRAALRAAGLPDDGDEGKGHAGIFPHPPGPKGIGRCPFLPWSGLTAGAHGGLFVDPAGGVPFDRQESVLEDAHLHARAEILRATATLRAMASSVSGTVARGNNATTSTEANVARHDRLRDIVWKLAGSVPAADLHEIALGVAHRVGLLAEGREQEVRDLVGSAIAKRGEGERPEVWTPSTMAGVLSPEAGHVEEIVEGLIPARVVTVIGAAWKTGKTLLAYRLALDFLTGRRVFGNYSVPKPGRVLIFQLEMPREEDDRRFRRLAIGSGIAPEEVVALAESGALTVYNRVPLFLKDERGRAALRELVKQHSPDLVILDSLIAALAGADLNDNSEVRELFTRAFSPILETGPAILALHHKRKAPPVGRGADDDRSALLGAQAFGAAAGRIFSLDRIPDATEPKDASFKVKLSVTGSWTPGGTEDAIIEIKDRDGGTDVRVIGEGEQYQRGGVTKTQRAAIALANLIRIRRAVERADALVEIQADLDIKSTAAEDGLALAKARGWVASRPIEGTKNRHELIPGPNLEDSP